MLSLYLISFDCWGWNIVIHPKGSEQSPGQSGWILMMVMTISAGTPSPEPSTFQLFVTPTHIPRLSQHGPLILWVPKTRILLLLKVPPTSASSCTAFMFCSTAWLISIGPSEFISNTASSRKPSWAALTRSGQPLAHCSECDLGSSGSRGHICLIHCCLSRACWMVNHCLLNDLRVIAGTVTLEINCRWMLSGSSQKKNSELKAQHLKERRTQEETRTGPPDPAIQRRTESQGYGDRTARKHWSCLPGDDDIIKTLLQNKCKTGIQSQPEFQCCILGELNAIILKYKVWTDKNSSNMNKHSEHFLYLWLKWQWVRV